MLALGRIGDRRALVTLSTLTNTSGDVAAALQAAQCMLGDTAHRGSWLTTTARSQTSGQRPYGLLAALGAIATDAAARMALLGLAQTGPNASLMKLLSHSRVSRSDAPTTFLCGSPQHLRVSVQESSSYSATVSRASRRISWKSSSLKRYAPYWKEGEGSSARTLVATLIEKLEF